MIKYLSLFFSLFLTTCLAFPAWASTTDLATEEEVMEMLLESGVVETLAPMMDQMNQSLEHNLKLKIPKLKEGARAIIVEELQAANKEMLFVILSKQAKFFSRHMTKSDVAELTRIYKLPVIKKCAEIAKRYAAEEFQKTMAEAPAMIAQMLKRVVRRLVEEGYITKEEAKI